MLIQIKKIVHKIKSVFLGLATVTVLPVMRMDSSTLNAQNSKPEEPNPNSSTLNAQSSKPQADPKPEKATLEAKLAETEINLKKAINGYKNLLVTANPEVLPELIKGETLEDLNNSLAIGKELTGKIRANLELNIQKNKIPAGAPTRGPEDISGLSAREKIERGIHG